MPKHSINEMPPNLIQALLMLGATSLSLGVYVGNGTISTASISLLLVAVTCVLSALLAVEKRSHLIEIIDVPVGFFAGICLCVQFAALIWQQIGAPLAQAPVAAVRILSFVLAIAAVISGGVCSGKPWLEKLSVPILAMLAGLVGLFIIGSLPTPGIDVLMFQFKSIHAFLQGINPYSIQFPDPYPPAASAMFYGVGVSVDGVLQFGFPYMPLTLLMALPGYLAGDVRYAHMAAMIAAAILIWRTAPDRPSSSIAAAMLLFSPIFPLMLFLGWTESFIVFLLTLTVYCHFRRPLLMPYALGLLLASKQYMPLLAPLALLFVPRPWTWRAIWNLAWRSGLTWCVVSLPMILWNIDAFMESAVWLQFRQPYRPDAMSFLVWFSPSNPAEWMWLPFAAMLSGIVLCLFIARNNNLSFPLAVAICLILFFCTNKQAFANYYYLVAGGIYCAVGTVEINFKSNDSIH